MKKSICFFYFVFLIAFLSFACVFPYPLLSRYTNYTEKQVSTSNRLKETEITKQKTQKNKVLTISWDEGINSLLEIGNAYELYDFSTKQSFNIRRIGGTNHADIIPANEDDFLFITQNLPQDSYTPVALIYNSTTIIPASLYAYMHGYLDNNSPYHGHYCLHFKASKTHETNNIDYFHQKAIKQAQKQAQRLLTD